MFADIRQVMAKETPRDDKSAEAIAGYNALMAWLEENVKDCIARTVAAERLHSSLMSTLRALE